MKMKEDDFLKSYEAQRLERQY